MKLRKLKHRYDVPRRYDSLRGQKRWVAWMTSKRPFNRWYGYNPDLNKHRRRKEQSVK